MSDPIPEENDPEDEMWTCTECGDRFEGPPEHDFPVLCDDCWEKSPKAEKDWDDA